MTSDFEKFLGDNVPEIPDPGDVRRLNRRDLQHLLSARTSVRWSCSPALMSSLALMLIMIGAVGELGSDNFEFTSSHMADPNLTKVGVSQIYRAGFRGQPVLRMDDWTEADAREFANQDYNDEGKLLRIQGWETTTARDWEMEFGSTVGGKSITRARSPHDRTEKINREFFHFMVHDRQQIMNNLLNPPGILPQEKVITIEGVAYPFKVWNFRYPGQGKVSYYRWEADH